MNAVSIKTLYDVYQQMNIPHIFIETVDSEHKISVEQFKKKYKKTYITYKKLGLSKEMNCFFRLKIMLNL